MRQLSGRELGYLGAVNQLSVVVWTQAGSDEVPLNGTNKTGSLLRGRLRWLVQFRGGFWEPTLLTWP